MKRDDVKWKTCCNSSGVMNLLVPHAAGEGHLDNSLLCPHHVRGLLSCGSCKQPRAFPGCGHKAPRETSAGLPGHSPGLPGRANALLKGLKCVHVSGNTSNKCEYKSAAKPTDSCPVCQCYTVNTEVHDKFKCCSANKAGIWFQIHCTLHLIKVFWGKKDELL